jgi:hypothetical protein
MANGGSGNFQAGAQTQAIAYGNYQIGGGFSGQSLFFIDGVESNIPENNVNSLVPTQDSVQEFRVSTNNVTAEFGGFSGGVVQISTKSGTNQIHGSVYEYFRNTIFDANDYFSNHATPKLARPPLHQNQYGANIGGPIIKDKLFAFFSFERETLTSGAISTFTLPTAAQLNGDFSAFSSQYKTTANPTGQFLYNPATNAPYACNGVANTLCANQIDPTALKLLQLEFPLPNVPNALVNNYLATAPISGAQNQFNARLDYNLGKADQLFARYTFWNPHNGPSDPFGTKTGAGRTGNTTQEAVLGDNHIFNGTTIGDLRLSYLENYNFQYPLSDGFDMSSIGPAYGTIQSQSQGQEGLLPGLGIQGYGIGAELSQLYWNNTVYSLSGSVTKILGRHTIKSGAMWRQVEWTNYGNSQGLGIGASAFFTASSPSDTQSGNGLASFLLGIPSSAGISSVGTWRAFLHNYALYTTDTFQATSKLTLTAGLRWSQPGAYSEVHNLDTVLQPTAPVTIGGLSSITNPVTGQAVPLTGQLAFVDSAQSPSRREEALHWKLFAPRLGAAYRLDANTVVRSGYGISYLPAEITADSPGNSPINSAPTNYSNTIGQTPIITVANPLAGPVNLPSGRTQAGLNAALGQGIGGRYFHQSYGYAQQWNFDVERALDTKTTLSVAYAGAKGTHLVLAQGYTGTGFNLNQLPDQYDSLGTGSATTPGTLLYQVPNPFYNILPATTLYGQPTIAEGYLLEPHPQYSSVNQTVPRYGDSTYNALQVMFTRRFPHNGIVQGAYTWAKLLSNTDNTSSFQDGQGGLGNVQDYNNLKAEKSVSQQDLPNNLVINYGLDLPFGRGQTYLGSISRLEDEFIGGWRVTGITILRSGIPLALVANGNTLSQFGAGSIRPNYVAGCNKSAPGSPHSPARAAEWFNTACFTTPASNAFGDEPRVDPSMKSAGEDNFDFSGNKTFAVTERVNLKFSAEVFNLFNHALFAEPDVNQQDPAFGTVQHQSDLPRTVQFALRLNY